MRKLMTLCMVSKNNQVLLGLKKTGLGEGRFNGFGGKVEEGETIEGAAIRELKEETGLTTLNIEKVGILNATFKTDPREPEVHIFKVNEFQGEPIETDEMKPEWFNSDAIPLDNMWPGDRYWIGLFAEGKKFKINVQFDEPSNKERMAKVLSYEVTEVTTLDE
jgi:8-oxo-dGTP pyrophosphatase MutT (NUDIX family)